MSRLARTAGDSRGFTRMLQPAWAISACSLELELERKRPQQTFIDEMLVAASKQEIVW